MRSRNWRTAARWISLMLLIAAPTLFVVSGLMNRRVSTDGEAAASPSPSAIAEVLSSTTHSDSGQTELPTDTDVSAASNPAGPTVLFRGDWGDQLGEFGLDEGPTGRRGPLTLALRSDGSIYVLDTVNARVQVFDVNGSPMRAFLVEGQAVDGIAVTSDGYVVLNAFSERQLLVYDENGQKLPPVAVPSEILPLRLIASGDEVWIRGLLAEQAQNGVISDFLLVWKGGSAQTAEGTRVQRMANRYATGALTWRGSTEGAMMSIELEAGDGSVRSVSIPGSEDILIADCVEAKGGGAFFVSDIGNGEPGWRSWRVSGAGELTGPVDIPTAVWTEMNKAFEISPEGYMVYLQSDPSGVAISRAALPSP